MKAGPSDSATSQDLDVITDIRNTVKVIDDAEFPASTDFLSESVIKKLMSNAGSVEDILRHVTVPNAIIGCHKVIDEIQSSMVKKSEGGHHAQRLHSGASNGSSRGETGSSDRSTRDGEGIHRSDTGSEAGSEADGTQTTDTIRFDHLSPIFSSDAERTKFVSLFFESMKDGHGGTLMCYTNAMCV